MKMTKICKKQNKDEFKRKYDDDDDVMKKYMK